MRSLQASSPTRGKARCGAHAAGRQRPPQRAPVGDTPRATVSGAADSGGRHQILGDARPRSLGRDDRCSRQRGLSSVVDCSHAILAGRTDGSRLQRSRWRGDCFARRTGAPIGRRWQACLHAMRRELCVGSDAGERIRGIARVRRVGLNPLRRLGRSPVGVAGLTSTSSTAYTAGYGQADDAIGDVHDPHGAGGGQPAWLRDHH